MIAHFSAFFTLFHLGFTFFDWSFPLSIIDNIAKFFSAVELKKPKLSVRLEKASGKERHFKKYTKYINFDVN